MSRSSCNALVTPFLPASRRVLAGTCTAMGVPVSGGSRKAGAHALLPGSCGDLLRVGPTS